MKKIAVIGSGIAGLTSAYLLSREHQVHLFEKNDYLGGHTATVDVELAGHHYQIDTGFIVFNDWTYPNFLKLLDQIGVGRQETEMSFSVQNRQTGLEYNGHDLNTLFAQRRNLISLRFWSLINSILKFNKHCKQLASGGQIDPQLTLGSFLQQNNFSSYFAEHYILPMGAAIWSSSLREMEAFPLRFFVQFFHNHGLLNVSERPQWYVIPGGSKNYIEPLIQSFKQRIRLSSQLTGISRHSDGVTLKFQDGTSEQFDEVVLACHSDQALALLEDPSEQENAVLGSISYTSNEVVLHTDVTMLPKRKLAWASWNYQLSQDRARQAAVTYNMNILQGLQAPHTFCVTLNQTEAIAPDKILRKFTYDHPVFNRESMAAQQQRQLICGQRHTHFAGAYWYNGFHEDGVKSGVDVANRFGIQL